VTRILFGVAPLVSTLRTAVNNPLKEAGAANTRERNTLRHVLFASEVALAVIVLGEPVW